jgi:UDP-N-acetylmuramyl pentapeptide phosphotransferase/UDP-N-acetylglucosamine-1-phosphate transferase
MNNPVLASVELPDWFYIISGLFLSGIITLFGIPAVIKIARIKNIYDIPNNRTSHDEPTPRLGGLMIFAGVIMSSVLFTGIDETFELKYLIAGLLVIFFIGLKDDIITLVPAKKAAGQLIASLIIVVLGNIRINIGQGITATPEIAYLLSVILSAAILMVLINSLNLIDGIDGLAAGIGLTASVVFGSWFVVNGIFSYAVICFSLAGSLIAFLWYNLFSRKFKMFLGDTGSMVIGLLLAVFVIEFLELNHNGNIPKRLGIAPALALAILLMPVFDVFRISLVRILNRKSPFNADNNHIHHKVLKLAGSHIKATAFLLSFNILLIILTLLLRFLGNTVLIISLVAVILVFSILITITLRHNGR